MHTPIVWSDRRPTDKEFRESFSATKLSAQKMLDFMHHRQGVIQKVVLTNSEGYWSGESHVTVFWTSLDSIVDLTLTLELLSKERKENTTPLGNSIKSSLKCNQATLWLCFPNHCG